MLRSDRASVLPQAPENQRWLVAAAVVVVALVSVAVAAAEAFLQRKET
jgi:hypothetical protein